MSLTGTARFVKSQCVLTQAASHLATPSAPGSIPFCSLLTGSLLLYSSVRRSHWTQAVLPRPFGANGMVQLLELCQWASFFCFSSAVGRMSRSARTLANCHNLPYSIACATWSVKLLDPKCLLSDDRLEIQQAWRRICVYPGLLVHHRRPVVKFRGRSRRKV